MREVQPLSEAGTRILRSRWYPGAIQALFLAGLVFVGATLAWGPPTDEANPGALVLWYVWWPLLPLSFFFFGRLWCALCPIPLLTEGVQRLGPAAREVPRFLRRHGAWLLFGTFFALHVANLLFGLEESIPGTRLLLVVFLASALGASLLLPRRAWCRFLCPLGAMAGTLATTGALRLSCRDRTCRGECRDAPCQDPRAALACPVFERPRNRISPRECSFCGRCVKACPHSALSLELHPPLAALSRESETGAGEASLALLLLGIAASMGVKHISDWPILFWSLTGALHLPPTWSVEMALHLLVSAFPLALFVGASQMAARGEGISWRLCFRRFASGFHPLLLAAVVAVNLRGLLVAGPMNLKGILFSHGIRLPWLNAVQRLEGVPLQALAWAVILLGAAGSIFVWGRRGQVRVLCGDESRVWPYGIVLGILTTGLLWIYSHPMST